MYVLANRPRLAFALSLLCLGCADDDDRGARGAVNSEFRVTLYSGGRAVCEWTSVGRVQAEAGGVGRFFRDKSTGKLIRVSGNVAVEEL